MKTLLIKDGDLVIEGSGYAMVTGPRKVSQDLRFAVGEPLGNDRFHPGWGSRLESYLGPPADSLQAANAQAEVARVVNNYVAVQRDMLQRDILAGVKSRFTTGDLVGSVDSIAATVSDDTVTVKVSIRTLDRTPLSLATNSAGALT